MTMKCKSLIIIVLFLLFSLYVSAYEIEKKLTLPAHGIDTFQADCGSGYLKITGETGLKRVEVKATIWIEGYGRRDAEFFVKDKIVLTLEKKGGRAVLVSKVRSSFIKRPESAVINLDVRVPKNISLDIDDGSGLIEITDIGGCVKLEDGSGSIEVKNIGSKVDVDDGSDSLDLYNIYGDVKIDDGSGSISAEEVKGNIRVKDSSGGITIKDLDGDVDIDDSSGDINVTGIGGSVVVEDGSGGIYIDGVAKDVIIKSVGSGSLSIRNVKGKVKK
jgi:hypothetical protein